MSPFDQVFVRKAPGFSEQGTFNISGELVYSGTYAIIDKNERISDALNRAGGLIPGSNIDLMLQPGDSLHIPRLLQTVKVSGNVMNPIALTYEPRISLKQYIDMAGGYSESSRKKRTYVIYPNGTTTSTHGLFKTLTVITTLNYLKL